MPDYELPYASHDLTGQVALVTGATSGLGWRFSQVLAAAGATVVPTGRREERLFELEQKISDSGGQAHPCRVDMTDAESIVAAVDHAERVAGPPQILINNAGIPDAQRAHKMPLDLIDRVIDTNPVSYTHLTLPTTPYV